MKMKRNGLLALMLASLTAVCLLTACNNGNSDNDDAPAAIAPAGTITTLNGKTFVCASGTITMEFSTPQSKPDGSGGTYTKAITTYTNCNYITGTSDTAAKYYSWDISGSSYYSNDITYSISGNTITFTWPATTYSSSSTKTATITGGNSFKISGTSSSSSGMTSTTGDQVFTEGSAPSSGSTSTSYQ